MDKVLYLADDFAIMKRGKASKYEPDKELRALFDLRPGTASYSKHIVKFLEQFGSRYDYGNEPLEIRACTDRDKSKLLKLGFDVLNDEACGAFYLSKLDTIDLRYAFMARNQHRMGSIVDTHNKVRLMQFGKV